MSSVIKGVVSYDGKNALSVMFLYVQTKTKQILRNSGILFILMRKNDFLYYAKTPGMQKNTPK